MICLFAWLFFVFLTLVCRQNSINMSTTVYILLCCHILLTLLCFAIFVIYKKIIWRKGVYNFTDFFAIIAYINEWLLLRLPNNIGLSLKGQWTTSSSSPDFFFQKSWDFYTIRSVYLCNDSMLNHTCSFNFITKIRNFSCGGHFFKSLLLKMAATVLTVEFGTIILVRRKILKLACAVLWTDTKINWTFCKLLHFGWE